MTLERPVTNTGDVALAVDSPVATPETRHAIFRMLWHAVNALLILSALAAIYSSIWEYSTRRYLKGFSDAIIPAGSPPQEKIDTILDWMAYGPKRQDTLLPASGPNRDPTDTLNYAALLKVCGTATNAFLNLADSSGLSARRLLLLDYRQMTKHVVAEVFVDGRWIIVDPAFRQVLRNSDGLFLTREELADPAVLRTATRNIRNDDPDYTYDRTAHVRVGRLRILAAPAKAVLDHLLPGLEGSPALSLILERESLAALVVAFALVPIFLLFRTGLRRHGENRLGVRPMRIRRQLWRALSAFVDASG